MFCHKLFGFMPQGEVPEDDITLFAKQKLSKGKIDTLAILLVIHCASWIQPPHQNRHR